MTRTACHLQKTRAESRLESGLGWTHVHERHARMHLLNGTDGREDLPSQGKQAYGAPVCPLLRSLFECVPCGGGARANVDCSRRGGPDTILPVTRLPSLPPNENSPLVTRGRGDNTTSPEVPHERLTRMLFSIVNRIGVSSAPASQTPLKSNDSGGT